MINISKRGFNFGEVAKEQFFIILKLLSKNITVNE